MQANFFGNSETCAGREQGEVFPGKSCGGERRDLGNVVGRRHLDDVHSLEFEAGESAQDRLRLPGEEAADLRGAGAGREGRVERIDVEAEIDRRVADDLADPLGSRLRAAL